MTAGADQVSIDLGEFRQIEAARPARRPRHRTLAAATLTVLLAASLTASRQPLRLVETARFGVDGGYAIDDTQVYAMNTVAGSGLDAYRLADGRRTWTVTLGSDHLLAGFSLLAGTVFAVTGKCSTGSDAQAQAIDRATGRVRWRHHGSPIARVAHTNLVVFEHDTPDPPCDAPQPPAAEPSPDAPPTRQRTVEALDLDTGRPVWTARSSGPVFFYNLDPLGDITQIVAVEQSGLARVYDLRTGTVAATGTLPVVRTPDGTAASGIWPAFGLVMVSDRRSGEVAIAAYSASSLRPIWTQRLKVPPADTSLDDPPWLQECGVLLCVQSFNQVAVLDPVTGAIGWQLDQVRQVASGNGWLIASGRDGGLRLIDTRTGHAVRALPGYQYNQESLGDRLRFVLTRWVGGNTRIEELDPDGQRRVLGTVPDYYDQCQTTREFVVCARGTTTIRTWRIIDR
jgi:outer membrane protein assembly factor BamB